MPDQTKRALLKPCAHTGQCTPTHFHYIRYAQIITILHKGGEGGGVPCPWDSRSHKKTVFRDCQLFQLNDVTVWGQGSILENGMVLFLVAKCKTASNNSSQDIQSFWRFQIILKKIHSGLARISWSKGGHRIIFGGILSSRAALDHLRMAREWRIYTAEGPPVIYAPLSSPFSWVIYFLVLTGTQYYIERSGRFCFQSRNICIWAPKENENGGGKGGGRYLVLQDLK